MTINIPDNTSAHLKLSGCKAYSINNTRKKYNAPMLLTGGSYTITYVQGGSYMSYVPTH